MPFLLLCSMHFLRSLSLCFNVSLEFVSYIEFKSEWEFCSNKSTPVATTKKHISSHKCKAFYCEAKLHKATTKLSRRRHYLDYAYLFEETPRWSVSIKGGGFAVVFGLTRGAESKTWARGQLKYYATRVLCGPKHNRKMAQFFRILM